jgi:prepilin-type N-terminal cleavage/methylation domain-containing protein
LKNLENTMKSQQSGFTLVEIAIVLVIIGLLLGGILKGQELINSARVKNLANDFRVVPTYLYAYQDKFRALPGDDPQSQVHVGSATVTTAPGNGNGIIEGAWNATAGETFQLWQQVRLANLMSGPTDPTDPTYAPRNATTSGRIGVSSTTAAQLQISGMTGTYLVCSSGILGSFAKQLDIQMDDGNSSTGSMRAVADGAAMGTPGVANPNDSDPYTVCMTF